MKKIFTLALLAILGMGNAFADEVTMKYSGDTTSNMLADGSNEAETLGLDASAWSVVAAKGSASNAPGLNKAGDFRLYYNANGSNTITVSSLTNATISSIAITFTGDTYSNVSVTVDGNEVSGTDGVFNINSSSFVLGNGNTSNVQVRISQIVITYSGGGGQVQTKTATSIQFAEGYQTNIAGGPDGMFPEIGHSVALPTATVLAGENTVAGATIDWSLEVKSWKEGKAEPTISEGKVNFVDGAYGEITVKAAYAGNDSYKPSTKTYTLKVHNASGLLSEMVNDIVDPDYSKDDSSDDTGSLTFYFFRNIDADGFPPVKNTVTYVNGKYIYLTDGQNNLLFYGTNSQNLKAGDVISGNVSETNLGGFWGYLKRYNKLPEFAFTDMNVKVEEEGAAPEPTTIAADALKDYINIFVKIEDAVYVSADKKNLTFNVGENELKVYNQFNVDVETLTVGATYTLTGLGAVYKTKQATDPTFQLYLDSFVKTAETGINTVKSAAAQNGAIYNIAGQKVSASYKGLVIKNGKKIVNK